MWRFFERRVAQRTAELAQTNAEPRASGRGAHPGARAGAGPVVRGAEDRAIGQLTGGVAHDFNNLLMAVLGNLDLFALPAGGRARSAAARHAMQGAQRGAALTQRMLAFARRQELEPAAADLAS